MDIYSIFYEKRIMLLIGPHIDEEHSAFITGCTIMFNIESCGSRMRPIRDLRDAQLIINTYGGEVKNGMSILCGMEQAVVDIWTINLGRAYSTGAVILASGRLTKRAATPGAYTLLHQPWIEHADLIFTEPIDAVVAEGKLINMAYWYVVQLFTELSGYSYEQILNDLDRDIFLTPKQTKEYGLIDILVPDAEFYTTFPKMRVSYYEVIDPVALP